MEIATIGEDGVVAYKAAAHCPCSEGLAPRDAHFRKHVTCQPPNELINKCLSQILNPIDLRRDLLDFRPFRRSRILALLAQRDKHGVMVIRAATHVASAMAPPLF